MKVISPTKTALHGTACEEQSIWKDMYAIIDMYAIVLVIIS